MPRETRDTFVYVTYIDAPPETVWKALLEPEFTRQYWGYENVSDWKKGSTWEHRKADESRTLALLGDVLEADPPRRLVITWADPKDRGKAERHSRVAFEIEPLAGMVSPHGHSWRARAGLRDAAEDLPGLAARSLEPEVSPGNRPPVEDLGVKGGSPCPTSCTALESPRSPSACTRRSRRSTA